MMKGYKIKVKVYLIKGKLVTYIVLPSLLFKDLRQKGERIVIYLAVCLDLVRSRMNGAPKETRTHS